MQRSDPHPTFQESHPADSESVAPHTFADELVGRLRRLGHPLCVGIDPHLERLAPLFRVGSMKADDPRTATAVEGFCRAMLDRIAGRVAIVKPQVAFFERLGWRGWRALERIVVEARRRGLLVILDAKRGDIGSTARAYAAAYLEEPAAVPVDALTLNPYLGRDSLEPFVDAALAGGRGLFVLVRTSNPGAVDFQNATLDTPGGHRRPLYEWIAEALGDFSAKLRGRTTTFSSLGVVVGATWPGESERIRELLPEALFLVPGYGAQGASATEAVRGFVAGPGGAREGGVVSSSRALLFPPGSDTDEAGRWERAVDGALDRAIGELSEAVGR